MLKAMAATLAFGTLLLPRADAYALFADADRVTIDPVVASGCGTQVPLTFTGTGEYSDPVQHLIITLDGTELLHSHSEPAAWTAGPATIAPGTHTVTATITDDLDHAEVMAQQTQVFSVAPCGVASSGQPSGGEADNQDCCPGPDPVAPKHARVAKGTAGQPQVKGAATRPAKLPGKLAPLNEIFRKVHGRGPTFVEWTYWAGRLLNDKPQFDAFFGALQWHELRGHSVGDPVPPAT